MTRLFHLGDVLSITTGKLVSPRLIEGVYDILNFMTGESLYTHQLGRAMAACRPSLLTQHPALNHIDPSTVKAGDWQQWLARQVKRHGKTLMVEPLPAGAYVAMDPLDELAIMVPPDKIIVVNTGGNNS